MEAATTHRIVFLDGLRGVAITLVVLYHGYARWPDLVPFGNRFGTFPLLLHGDLGVQLFFIISGFVIFMTLECCAGFLEFAGRRWLRLFPAMLICTAVVWFAASLLPERPAGTPLAGQLIPGLLFLDPAWLALVGLKSEPIEGAFWSLFVEAKFYLIAGAGYFLWGQRKTILILLALYGVAALFGEENSLFPGMKRYAAIAELADFADFFDGQFHGWFVAGALFYVHHSTGEMRALWGGVAVALVAALVTGLAQSGTEIFWTTLVAVSLVALFASALRSARLQGWLSHPVFQFLGFVSYPLYLIHENMMVALIIKLGKWAPGMPQVLLPVVPICAVILIGWIVARWGEPWVRKAIRVGWGYARRRARSEVG